MAVFTGTTNDDVIAGTAASDFFNMDQEGTGVDGGTDHVLGLGEQDTFDFGSTFSLGDIVDGGADDDTLMLTHGMDPAQHFTPATFISVENIELFDLFENGDFLSALFTMVFEGNLNLDHLAIDGSNLHRTDQLTVDLSAASGTGPVSIDSGLASILVVNAGSAGALVNAHGSTKCTITGGSKGDVLAWEGTGGGSQRLHAGGGGFNTKSKFDGAAGNDTLQLHGDMSAGVVFAATTIKNVEQIVMLHDFSYDLTLVDANVAAGARLTVYATGVAGAGSFVHFDGSAETDGAFTVKGGGNDGIYKTGAGDDVIAIVGLSNTNLILPGAGHDRISGSSSAADTVRMGAFFDALDRIDGVGGTGDTIELDGDYSAGVVFGKNTMHNIDILRFAAGHDYDLTLVDANLGAGRTLLVDATLLGSGDRLTLDGSREADGLFVFRGGAGADILSGGDQDDDFHGNGGGDTLRLGLGSNDLFYAGASDSTGLKHDVIIGFDGTRDWFNVGGFPTPSQLNSGSLSKATFDADLASVLNASVLFAHDGIAFTPDAGGFAGRQYLVIDMNGTAGYQAGQDLVLEFKNPGHWGTFNFFEGG